MNLNVLPLPSSLSTPRRPPIASTSRDEIVKPNPVPPKRRVVELSAWAKAEKMLPSRSGEMPRPVSRTAIWIIAEYRSPRKPVGITTPRSATFDVGSSVV